MPDTNFEIGLRVAVSSDTVKLSEVASDIDKVNMKLAESARIQQEAAGAAKEHASALDDLASKAAGVLAGFVSLRLAWDMIKEGTREALAQDRALGQLGNTVRGYGGDVKTAVEGTEALGRQLEGVGFNETEVIKATQKLTVVTGDHATALSAASLAADIAMKTGMEYGNALTIIQMLLTDSPRGVLMAQRQLGIEATSSADALSKISARFRGAAADADDATARIHKGTTLISDGFKALGGLIGTVLGKASSTFNDYILRTTENQLELTYKFKKMIGSTADADAWYAEALRKWKMQFGIPLGEEFKKLTDMSDKSLTSPANLEALGKRTAADMERLTKDVDAAVKDQEEKDRKAAEAQRVRNDALLQNFKADQELKQRRELWARIGKEELTAQAAQDQKLLGSMRLFEAQALHVKMLAQTDTKKMNLAELQSFRSMLAEELKSERLSLDERNALTLRSAEAQKQIRDIEAKNKTQQDAEAVAGTVTGIGQMFGASKAGAVASAAVNAFAAAAGAAAETHGDVYTRIAAYIAAFAQAYQAVTGIEGTEIGTGGGGAGGGAVYGGVSMSTPIPTIQNSSVQNTSSVRGGDTYVVSAITGSKALSETMQLQKALRPGSRAYDRTIVSRKGTSAGTVRR